MGKGPILSISLLSSGRKDTIWKCLDSLKPIMAEISCELIIVDTGCDEETHNRMREYTDQIVNFTWCNDFSKARNAGLEKAMGEWFMFIDDDEWFIDVAELVQFFKSGDYKNFGCANYIQRNYKNENGSVYTDSWVSRLIRLDEDTHFESSIHEYLSPVRGTCRLLRCPVAHYGYIFKTKKDKYEHSKRNVSLLEALLKDERKNLRGWTHLAQEYRGIEEWSKLKECCTEALQIYKEENNPDVNRALGAFYCGVMLAEMSRYNRKDAKGFLLSAIQDKRITSICKARLCSFGAELAFLESDYVECIEYCKAYFQIYDKYHDDEVQKFTQGAFFVYETFEREVHNNCYCFYICSALKLGDDTVLENHFAKLGWNEDVTYLYSTFVGDVIEAFSKAPNVDRYVSYAQTMLDRKGVDGTVFAVIQKIEKDDLDGFKRLCQLFAETESNYFYIWYLKIRNCGFNANCKTKGEIEEYYKELFDRVANIFQLDESIFEIARENIIDLGKLFLGIKFDQWRDGVDYFCKNAAVERILRCQKLVKSVYGVHDIRFDYFNMKIAEYLLFEQVAEEDTYRELREKMDAYVDTQLEFYQVFYKDIAFEGDMEMLPLACRIAVKFRKVLKAENVQDVNACIKECVAVYPSVKEILKKYLKLYIAERNRKEKTAEQIELEQLIIKMKKKIEQLIEQEAYEEAQVALEGIEAYVSEGELEGLKARIAR